ncbi:poly A polymerase head domain-containing protein [Hirsutella rhossiliensis]
MEPQTKRIKVDSVQEEPMATKGRVIDLLPAEQLLRELLLECAQHFPGLEIWITGGWVRDRLLGIPSSDLDFALSNVTGRRFGQLLEDLSARTEIEANYRQKAAAQGIPYTKFTRFHIMERNDKKAKKLETAGGKLFGLDIDLVNLRKEVYDGHSRTPEMEFGTPEEDAFRRDATINSLFFHLGKQEVVDLTGRGLEDLDAKIMRTPLDPRQTFMDDPLRVLRLIRVGSKLGFAIDPQAMRFMRDKDVQQALDTIITRDRIGIELFKMMRGSNPVVAFQYLFEANLCTPVFIGLNSPMQQALKAQCPTLGLSNSSPWPATWPQASGLLGRLLKDDSILCKMIQYEANADYLWTMAAYTPFAGLRQAMLRQIVDEATMAIRAPAKISKLFESALKNFDSIRTIVDTIALQSEKSPPRSRIGMAIRSWGATWTTQVTYVMLAEAVYAAQTSSSLVTSGSSPSLDEPLLTRYSAFAGFVYDNGLRDAHLQRPLLDGNEIQRIFGLQKGGQFLKTALDGLLAWQFDHAESGIEDAKMWLLDRRESLGIPSGGGW